MARARNIKPGFFQNEQLGELDPIDRLFFIGLWTVADYRGCVEFRAKRLKIQLLPWDNCDVENIAINLERSGLIRKYSVQGQTYLKIINFERHQNPHKNERDAGSDLPDITDEFSQVYDLKGLTNNLDKDVTKPDFIGTTRADSLVLIPDSLKLIPEDKPSSSEQSSDKAKSKFGNEDDHKTARWMFDRIKTILPNAKEPSWDSWANDVRLMRERDGHDHAAICALFEWANKDSFWSSNILSPAKLREKWDQLSVKRGKPAGASRGIHSFENIDYGQSGSL